MESAAVISPSMAATSQLKNQFREQLRRYMVVDADVHPIAENAYSFITAGSSNFVTHQTGCFQDWLYSRDRQCRRILNELDLDDIRGRMVRTGRRPKWRNVRGTPFTQALHPRIKGIGVNTMLKAPLII